MKIKYCDKCKRRGHLVKHQLIPKLQKQFPDAEFEVGCLSFCGPGSQQPFVFVDDELVYAKTDDELIDKLCQLYK